MTQHRRESLTSLPPCEFREVDADSGEITCNAAAGASLGRIGEGLAGHICGSCSMPRALESEWACLHLVAWADVDHEIADARYACRFFHTLYEQPWTDTETCHGCPYWFPRPALASLKDHAEWIERMKRFYTAEGLQADRERRRREVGDWRPPPQQDSQRGRGWFPR